ncbi:MAG: hypothetical protein H5T86_11950, partial [Armatimonadetes bacterium]|nr:hypothetical protein [Armatimonadota bacterium]
MNDEASRAVPITFGSAMHFFGYYDVTPWDVSDQFMLGLEVTFQDRPPTADDVATIGLVDTAEGDLWKPIAQTRAWNWQMGTRLQWLGSEPGRLIIHNDRREGRFVAVIRDAFTGAEEAVLPLPIYALNPAGTQAVTLNFSRVARTRPGYGYVGLPDPTEGILCPDNDGIWWMDLRTGEHDLIITIAQAAAIQPRNDMKGAEHWFNHLLWSPDGSRFIFLHRWRPPGARAWFTRLLTARPDGSDIRLLADDDLVSHFDWRDPQHVLAWARVKGVGDYYFLFPDQPPTGETGTPRIVGRGVLTCDGHCSYSPDRRWILTDTYPDAESKRTLILYHEREER